MSLSWINCCETGNGNDVINRNNAFIGLPDLWTEYCICRAPDCNSKDPGFSSWEGKPYSSLLVFDHCVGERLLWRWSIGRSLKFLAKVTRDVFARTKFLAILWKIKELIYVIFLRPWSTIGQSKQGNSEWKKYLIVKKSVSQFLLVISICSFPKKVRNSRVAKSYFPLSVCNF